jgi:hypothetical protein
MRAVVVGASERTQPPDAVDHDRAAAPRLGGVSLSSRHDILTVEFRGVP